MSKRTAPFGSWRSPISAELVAGGGVSLDAVLPADGGVLWLEGRPLEGGRYVVCQGEPGAEPVTLTPEGFNVRTRVHEYGGGAYTMHGGVLYFSDFASQRLYRQDPGAPPRPITPEPLSPAALRYADPVVGPDGSFLVCVRETHQGRVVTNELVVVATDGSAAPLVLAGGRDFYSFPRLAPDGRRLAWTAWDHPNMPWDATELRLAELSGSALVGEPELVAGGPDESIFQPAWSPGGALHFVSDRTGWWNLYRLWDGQVEALCPMEAEFGAPQWTFGESTYAFLPDGRIACLYRVGPVTHLGLLEPGSGKLETLDLEFTSFYPPQLRAAGSRLSFVGSSATEPLAVVTYDLDRADLQVLRRSRTERVDHGYLSRPRPIEFPTTGGRTAHALYYPPANADFQGPAGELPPLLVTSHGGPTAGVEDTFKPVLQYFTSQGFAAVDVDYGGSTGYGRAYRQRLNGRWGIVDTEDCIAAATWLADRGEVDRRRLAIRGGSAGGYTTLCALAFHDVFAAGASYFGVADAEALARETHKFESRYLDRLIGPYPQTAELYRQRSPIHFTERLSCPLILLQGLEDEVVPPDQAEAMARALDAKGIPYALLLFEGEQHGFRRAEHIRRACEAELYFYSRVFGFELAEPVEPVWIHHEQALR